MFGKRFVSLTLEGNSIRLLTAIGETVELWDSINFPSHLMRNGYIADPVKLGGLLRGALAQRKMPKGKLVCAFSAAGAMSRVLKLPKLATGQLRHIVEREARRLTDESPDKCYVHWQALPSGNGKQRVYILIVPKGPLHAFVKAVRAAGLNPAIMDFKPIALMRAVNRRDAIIANGENNGVNITIVVDDLPMMIESVHIGGSEISPDDAIARISDQLLRTVTRYADEHRDKPLAPDVPIYLTGSIGSSVASALSVSTLTQHPIGKLQPPLHYPDNLPVADYAVNMGLVLGAI